MAWDDQNSLCTLLPLESNLPSEAEQVRRVARAFFSIATGIDSEQLTDGKTSLSRWSKFGGQELSELVERCLTRVTSKSAVLTLGGVNRLLGRERAEGLFEQDAPFVIGSSGIVAGVKARFGKSSRNASA